MENKKNKFFHQFDFLLFLSVVVLSVIGIFIIYSATNTMEGGSMSYVKTQVISTISGLVCIFIFLKLDYEFLGKIYIPIYIFSVLILLLVFIPGVGFGGEESGSQSWARILGASFQPSEFAKLGLIIAFAKFIQIHQATINTIKTFLKLVAFAGFPIFLILLQPDLGTAMVFIFFVAVMLFVAGLDLRYFIFTVLSFVLISPIIWLNLKPYQKDRIFNFISPDKNASDSGYQVLQSKIAIGAGRIFGTGFLKGNQSQGGFLPEKHTDFIYSVLVEELGLIIGFATLVLFVIVIYRLVRIAKRSDDIFGSIMVIGIASILIFHIIENIGMTMGVLPTTGIPLPFVSYGGTFQLINFIAIGIAISVGMKNKDLNF